MISFLSYISPISGFIGTVLIFFFGIPRQTDTGGATFIISEEVDEKEKVKIKRYKFWGNFGLVCIALSFFLQITILALTSMVMK